ncbi:MAG: hypothetical protein R3B09_32720 [Nannocystaceae bacterium]
MPIWTASASTFHRDDAATGRWLTRPSSSGARARRATKRGPRWGSPSTTISG